MGRWFSLFINNPPLWLLAFALFFFVLMWAARARKEAKSEAWPLAKGEIWRVGRLDTLPPTLETIYSYRVGGRIYTGRDVRNMDAGAKEFRSRYETKRGEVMIRYNPAHPAISAIRDSDQAPQDKTGSS